jgi:Ca2+-binding RTX toxin-like protein
MVSKRLSLGVLVVALAGVLSVAVSVAPTAQARTTCSYAGAPTNLLTVMTNKSATTISRSGEEIVVQDRLEGPTGCRGAVPTVLNTDTIRVFVGMGAVAVRLEGGPLAPGATAEAEGAPEIELELRGGSFSSIIGTPQADEFHWGPGRAHPGLNLNPGDAADQDVDVSTVGRFSVLVAYGDAGNDRIVPGLGAVADNEVVNAYGGQGDDLLTAPQNTFGVLIGGRGKDTISGSRLGDFMLFGGVGADRIVGKEGSDRIVGGHGRDLLLAGRGRDLIKAADSSRDRVRCGIGRDRVRADRGDRLRGCERVSRR